MLIQVVHSHPLTDSYNHALFRIIVDQLQDRHQVIATDLYRERFSPVMTEAERHSYYQPAYAGDEVAPLVRQLRQADGIIFCFPHWWSLDASHAEGLFRPGLGAGNGL